MRIRLDASGGQKPYNYVPAQNFNYTYDAISGAVINVEVHTADDQHWYGEIVLDPVPACQ